MVLSEGDSFAELATVSAIGHNSLSGQNFGTEALLA